VFKIWNKKRFYLVSTLSIRTRKGKLWMLEFLIYLSILSKWCFRGKTPYRCSLSIRIFINGALKTAPCNFISFCSFLCYFQNLNFRSPKKPSSYLKCYLVERRYLKTLLRKGFLLLFFWYNRVKKELLFWKRKRRI